MAAAALVAGLLSVAAAEAQTWPNKSVKIIVPYQAGQGTDVATRYFADQLTKALGQTFYVDNKPGAGGNIGTEAAAHSPADGYTLLMGTNGTQTMATNGPMMSCTSPPEQKLPPLGRNTTTSTSSA